MEKEIQEAEHIASILLNYLYDQISKIPLIVIGEFEQIFYN